jgi:DNA adenine methylase
MKPVVKYQGGKTRELSLIQPYIRSAKRIIEPFCGGAAVSLHANVPSILNDCNSNVINLYNIIGDKSYFNVLLKEVEYIKTLGHDDLEKRYYDARDIINGNDSKPYDLALSYIIVRQLCFSGMERYNAKGEFNVPFGHYKKFACNLSPNHHTFFSKCEIYNEDAVKLIRTFSFKEGDFLFLDPPYLDRLGYSTGDGSDGLHERLASVLNEIDVPWLLIHSDCDFIRQSYSECIIDEIGFKYSQNFGKGKDHSNSKVKHLYVSSRSVTKDVVPLS